MTNEEAKEWVDITRMSYICDPNECGLEKGKEPCPLFHCDDKHDALAMAIKALESANKYRWHDLRKNPDDMPEFDTNILVCIDYRLDNRPEYIAIYVTSANWKLDIMEDYNPDYWQAIAWRYIEPFKEDEK